MRMLRWLPFVLLASACTISFNDSSGDALSYEVIEEPVEFYFDADPRNRSIIAKIAEDLEPHFPRMSWRIGRYDSSPDDGLAIQVNDRVVRDLDKQNCENCYKRLAVFVIFDRGRQIALEEFENCRLYSRRGDCFPIRRRVLTRRLVSTIDRALADTR